MGKSNKKVIIAICIIAVIVMILAAGVVLYLFTDLFKTDQQLFFKYIAQNQEVFSKFLEDPNKENVDSLKQNKYTTDGKISFDLTSNDTEIANQTIPARNFSIEYKTQVDTQANKDSSQTKLKFLDKDLFELKYAHDNDLYGITSTEVINKYLTFDNNNLKELATKYGITDVTNIPDKIEVQDYSQLFTISEQEVQYLVDNYANIIHAHISKDKYYHNKGIMIDVEDIQLQGNCYGVNITKEDFKNIITDILIKLQQDDQMLNAIIQRAELIDAEIEITVERLKEAIGELIIDAQENDEDLQDIKIEVYESQGKLVKMLMQAEDGNTLTIVNQTNENSSRAVLSFEYNNIENTTTDIQGVSFKVKSIELARQAMAGQSNDIIIFTLDAGNDKEYTVSVQSKMNQTSPTEISNDMVINVSDLETYFTVKINSVTTQSNDAKVEELTEANSAVINKFTPQYTASLVQAIGNRLQTLLTQKLTIIATTQLEVNEQTTIEQNDTNSTIIENNAMTNTVTE